MKKRLVAIVLTVATIMALAITPALAVVHYVGYARPIKCYSKESRTTIVYDSESEKSRRIGKIWASDEISIIFSSSRGWFYVSYPKDGGGTLEGWIKMGDVLANRVQAESDWDYYVWYPSRKITTYKRSSGGSYGSIYKGDEVRVYWSTNTGSRVQVRYPLSSGGYKFGWVSTSDARKYLGFCY